MTEKTLTLGAIIFPGFEMLDLFGPLEMFSLLAKAGVLDGHRATSNKQLFALAVAQSDKVEWIEQARWVDDGPVVTSSGVSAGTDMSLAVIQRLFGEEDALSAVTSAEYTWHRDADSDPFHSELNSLAGLLAPG